MAYQLLSKYKYNGNGPSKTILEIDQEYQNRLEGYSTIKTELYPLLESKAFEHQSAQYPIFLVQINSIIALDDHIRRNSIEISRMMNQLPGIAKESYQNKLLSAEIFATNEIEGVKTSRSEIGTIIAEQRSNIKSSESRRLGSAIRLYSKTLNGDVEEIHHLEDLRKIYDELLAGEITTSELPDGQLFRNKAVYIGTNTQTPPTDEASIIKMLLPLLSFMNTHQVPYLSKALIVHFMFENVHPFNDGNGRMGRYLLTSYLADKLDVFTGLSISSTIHTHRPAYYRIFKSAGDVENRGDLTMFVKEMMSMIEEGQEDVMTDLQNLIDQLSVVEQQLLYQVNQEDCDVAYIFAQSALFAGGEEMGIQDRELIGLLNKRDRKKFPKSKVSQSIQNLEAQGLLKTIRRRPLQHVLKLTTLKEK